MDLVSFSLRTKGPRNFARRLWTVFARFGVTDARIRRSLYAIVEPLQRHDAAPTFFIPAVVLGRHPALLRELDAGGTEIGIHGMVHNDYRTLTKAAQLEQTERAISIFNKTNVPFGGFRNPYLGWTEESLDVFRTLGLAYESNEAVLHDVIDLEQLAPTIRAGYEKSFDLFQAIPCSAYTVRPHVEDGLVRIPTSIPDDEMLFDRLRITDPSEVGRLWSEVLRRVYALGGIYTLNLHPERGVLCQGALTTLLQAASSQPLPVWITRLRDVAAWWDERHAWTMAVEPAGDGKWSVCADCSPRAAVLVRGGALADGAATPWEGAEATVAARQFVVRAERKPCIALSPETPAEVEDLLREQGYVVERAAGADADGYALALDVPEGFGETRAERIARQGEVLRTAEAAPGPLVHFGLWPEGAKAALSITGDIDSITVQDFFLRIVEVR